MSGGLQPQAGRAPQRVGAGARAREHGHQRHLVVQQGRVHVRVRLDRSTAADPAGQARRRADRGRVGRGTDRGGRKDQEHPRRARCGGNRGHRRAQRTQRRRLCFARVRPLGHRHTTPRPPDRRPRRRIAARGQPGAYPDARRCRSGRGGAAARHRSDQRPAGAVAAATGGGNEEWRQADRRQPPRHRAGPDCLPSPATPARHRSGPVAGAIGRRPRTGAAQRRSSRRRGSQPLAGPGCRANRRHGRDDPGSRRDAVGRRQRADVRRPALQPPVGSRQRGRGRLQPRPGNGQRRSHRRRRDLHPGRGERPGSRGTRCRARPRRTTGRGADRRGSRRQDQVPLSGRREYPGNTPRPRPGRASPGQRRASGRPRTVRDRDGEGC